MKSFVTTALAAALSLGAFSSHAATTQNSAPTSPDISPGERAKIEEVVHQYLVRKPEVLMEAIQALQKKQYEEAEQTVKQTQQIASSFNNALIHGNDPVAGNPAGKISIVEFFDYQCPHCIDMAPVIEGIIKTNPDVRIVFKEFPIRGPASDLAARAALAANLQGKYYPISHALLTVNKPLTQEVIMEIAKNNGLDIEKLKKDMYGKPVEDALKANAKLAQDLKLFGTPAFFIGKSTGDGSIKYYPGQLNQKQMQAAIDEANH